MSRTCAGCGGVLGRDCWNEADCVWISQDMMRQAARPPEPCQGCHYVTGLMTACLGVCAGMTCQEDADARAAIWASLPTTFATPTDQPEEVRCGGEEESDG